MGDIGGSIGDGSCNRLVEVIMVVWGSSGYRRKYRRW